MTCPRLIEVALPIREISAESVRDKSLRHGHPSTLHLWWARRPLPASRALVFASLVPDPDHPECPPEFRSAVARLLRDQVPDVLTYQQQGREWVRDRDPYRPYADLPDTLRNRLLAFIAKWSPQWIAFEKERNGKEPATRDRLDDRCLVKWETSDPESPQGRAVLEVARELIRVANGGRAPTVLDPFAGGGAIPLEAGRLGCQAVANDYNPVAYLILRATCEFPQKYGKPGRPTPLPRGGGNSELTLRVREGKHHLAAPDGGREVDNVLAHDVERWATWILERARERIGHLYPSGSDGLPVVGYLWARTAPCANPSCRAEIPLLRSLLVCNKSGKKVALDMRVNGKEVSFGIAKGRAIKRTEGTMVPGGRGDARCPVCQQITPVGLLRQAGLDRRMGERMVAVITDTPGGKDYRPVEERDLIAFREAAVSARQVESPSELVVPDNTRDFRTQLYGYKTYGSLFNPRQLLAIQTFIACLREALAELERSQPDPEYRRAVAAYLGFWVSRFAQRGSSMGIWDRSRETLAHPFGRQAIPMIWDYPEGNPFSDSTGGAIGNIEWINRVIRHESPPSSGTAQPARVLLGDAARLPLPQDSLEAVVTDPPYFDEIAYADLSDFFYVWLKRGLGDVFPDLFATPLTPKGEEATALKHRQGGSGEEANRHFTEKLAASLAEAHRVCREDGIVTVMFAHQSTEAWTALVRSLFKAGLTITATYPIDTEMKSRLVAMDASALESSITVACRPRQVGSAASLRSVRREIEAEVAAAVQRFWGYGFRGADLIVACYGPAVGVFGRYERVERADGTPVEVPELLQMAREAALKAIAGEFTGDSLSRLYFVWANLYGIGQGSWDDARLMVQVGVESESAIEVARGRGLFVVDGSSCRLALLRDRRDRHNMGEEPGSPLIDQLHHAMMLWQDERRSDLVTYLKDRELLESGPFWKLAQALFEVLPRDEPDWKLLSALLSERESLRLEAIRRPGRLL